MRQQTRIEVITQLDARNSGNGKFAICSRCIHSGVRMTSHGAVLHCAHPEQPIAVPVGRARAPSMPCGPLARRSEGYSAAPSALELERVESETANGDAWRDLAARLGRAKVGQIVTTTDLISLSGTK